MYLSFALPDTEPFTDYRIIVTAFTLKYDGEPSEVSLRTDVGGPSPPKVLNLTCHSLDTLFFSWRIPRVYHSSIDFYIVNYRNLEYDDTHEIRISANASIVETSVGYCLAFAGALAFFVLFSSPARDGWTRSNKSPFLALSLADGYSQPDDEQCVRGEGSWGDRKHGESEKGCPRHLL